MPKAPFAFTDVADYNGDSKADVVAADATGSLWLYPGNGGGWSTSAVYIGSGLSGYTFAGIGDFKTAGYADIVAMAPGCTLRLFRGDAGHDLLTQVTNFASRWNGYTFAGVADFNRDGKPDVIGRHPDGTLRLFPGTGTGAGLDTSAQIGTSWTSFTFAGVADLNGDANPDVIAREDATGILWLYPRTATAFSTRQQIGTGW
ncbi:FG-GAP repeat domain-containing protein [Streptomyces sp. NPDC003737]|uniref:FG-GAP repeat domain-containing protein n=1 Tax=Streptomyces sp. NPDC003737 TaxID=3364685 RepID=UPI00367B7620